MSKRIEFGSVTVFGGATMDHAAATFAPPVLGASNPGSAGMAPGGVGLNVARNLSRLGHRVRLVSRVGADADGAAVIAAAREARLDPSWIAVSPTARTATYRAAFDNVGGLIIGIADMAIFEEMTPAATAAALAGASPRDLVVVDANLPPDTLATLVEAAARAGRSVAAIAVSPAKAPRLAPLLDRIAVLFATRREAGALLGHADEAPAPAETLAAARAERGGAHVVVTNAAEPLAAAAGGEVISLAPLPSVVRSVNGAGDALAAGTLHGLAIGRPFFEAVRYGLAAAAITVEEGGTVAATLDSSALVHRLALANRVPA
jgi:sugar/nucleoside kinase (ribokinase family)